MGRRKLTPLQQIDALFVRVEQQGDCWVWTGGKRNGYGAVWYEAYGQYLAHRAVYERMVCEIPDGLTLDHLCRNKLCVNPDHLDPVPTQVNTARIPLRTHCPRGHSYEGENAVWRSNRRGPECRICKRRQWRAWHNRYTAAGGNVVQIGSKRESSDQDRGAV